MSSKTKNNTLPPTPKLGSGYYVFGDTVLVHISGITFDPLVQDWVYNMEVVADKSKSFGAGKATPIVSDIDNVIHSLHPKRIDDKGARKTLEVLFSASESINAWESSINEDPIVSEAAPEDTDDEF